VSKILFPNGRDLQHGRFIFNFFHFPFLIFHFSFFTFHSSFFIFNFPTPSKITCIFAPFNPLKSTG